MLIPDPTDPLRRPDWRWTVAEALCNQTPPAPWPGGKHGDALGRALCTFLKQWRVAEATQNSGRRHMRLADRYPDQFAAHQLFQDERLKGMRDVIDARILAGENDASITAKIGISAAVLGFYVPWFYDVRDRLQRPDLIMTVVLPEAHKPISEARTDLTWKLAGFLGGPVLLDAILHHRCGDQALPASQADVQRWIKTDTKGILQRRTNTVCRTLQFHNSRDAVELMNVYMRMLEMEQASNEQQAENLLLQSLQEALSGADWNPNAAVETDGWERRAEVLLMPPNKPTHGMPPPVFPEPGRGS